MHFLVTILCALAAFSALEAAPSRQKRFAGLGLTNIGGNAGCVITGNVLYANGYRLRELTSAEQKELEEYEQAVKDYKQELHEALEERRQQLQQRLQNRRNRTPSSRKGNSNSITIASDESQQNVTIPKPPQKPTFCTAQDTTQYYFDGCMIQNNKVYVGGHFARNLTDEEVQELQDFDKSMTAYQQQLQSSIQQQVQSIFGQQSSFFSQLFGGPQQQDENSSPTSPVPSTSTSETDLQAPTPPNFCVAIF